MRLLQTCRSSPPVSQHTLNRCSLGSLPDPLLSPSLIRALSMRFGRNPPEIVFVLRNPNKKRDCIRVYFRVASGVAIKSRLAATELRERSREAATSITLLVEFVGQIQKCAKFDLRRARSGNPHACRTAAGGKSILPAMVRFPTGAV